MIQQILVNDRFWSQPNLIVQGYEDLIDDPVTGILQLAGHLGLKIAREEAGEVAVEYSFQTEPAAEASSWSTAFATRGSTWTIRRTCKTTIAPPFCTGTICAKGGPGTGGSSHSEPTRGARPALRPLAGRARLTRPTPSEPGGKPASAAEIGEGSKSHAGADPGLALCLAPPSEAAPGSSSLRGHSDEDDRGRARTHFGSCPVRQLVPSASTQTARVAVPDPHVRQEQHAHSESLTTEGEEGAGSPAAVLSFASDALVDRAWSKEEGTGTRPPRHLPPNSSRPGSRDPEKWPGAGPTSPRRTRGRSRKHTTGSP